VASCGAIPGGSPCLGGYLLAPNARKRFFGPLAVAEDPPRADFVTVLECGRSLGISPRQVRRFAEKLGTGDRAASNRTKGGQPILLVSLSAVRALLEREKSFGASPESAPKEANGTGEEDGQEKRAKGQKRTGEGVTPLLARLTAAEARVVDLEAHLVKAEREAERFHGIAENAQRLADQAQRLHASDRAELEELRARLMIEAKPLASDGERPSSAGASVESSPARPWWRFWERVAR
jgi:hypothetical protein